MTWHSLLYAAIALGKAILPFGVAVLSILVIASRVATYKRTGELKDFLKIFSRY
jgi:hypothetical protein